MIPLASKAAVLKGIVKEVVGPFLKTVTTKAGKRSAAREVREATKKAFESATAKATKAGLSREAIEEAAQKAAREAAEKVTKHLDDVAKRADEVAARAAKMTDKELKDAYNAARERLGKGISPEEYEFLRARTPNKEIKDIVNEGHYIKGMDDPVFPGRNTINDRLEADHIVPMQTLTRMDGFDKLTPQQKLDLLNDPANFMGLSKNANASKGALSWQDWPQHKSKGWPVDRQLRITMIRKEQEMYLRMQAKIDAMLGK